MDIIKIVEKLEELNLIRTSRIIGNYYQIYCPIHNDGNERKPSCGILLNEEVRNGQRYPEGFTHCFSCGLAKPLPKLIEEILKTKHISNKSGLEWLKENVGEFEETEFDYLIPQTLTKAINAQYAVNYISSLSKNKIKYVEEDELQKYRYTIDYLYDRKLNDEIINKFDVGVDLNYIPPNAKRKVPCITFPVRDYKGRTLFIYRRAIEKKNFYMPSGLDKPIYGIYELPKNVESVILCESIFNALTCWVYGYPALALFGTGTSSQLNDLKKLGIKEFVLGLDPDEAGDRGAIKIRKALKNIAIIRRMEDIPSGKDINDLTKEEFIEIYKNRI